MSFRILSLLTLAASALSAADTGTKFDYRVLATNKTSTMEKEINEAAAEGYVFAGAMGGESAFRGNQMVTVMKKDINQPVTGRRYKVLATVKTSTLAKELNDAGKEGFAYCGQTIYSTTFGGREVALVLEYNPENKGTRIEYKLAATARTSTMQKELSPAGEQGFLFQGMVVGNTVFGGSEVISILQKSVREAHLQASR
jgi:hypothetical protein